MKNSFERKLRTLFEVKIIKSLEYVKQHPISKAFHLNDHWMKNGSNLLKLLIFSLFLHEITKTRIISSLNYTVENL